MHAPSRRMVLAGMAGMAGMGVHASVRASVALGAAPDAAFAAIERRTGGRLGVALLDAYGALLAGHRADERFAMCSTFKAPLAAAVLEAARAGRFSLSDRIAFGKGDLVPYAPVVEAALGAGSLGVEALAAAAVELSDNAAANLLLRRIGGPGALTAFCRRHGDHVTRLDRIEPALNENRPGDPRDSSSPRAMAGLLCRLLIRGGLAPMDRDRLNGWMVACRTGLNRIRAGLPEGWIAGDKTGTGKTAFNDVAIIRPPAGNPVVLAVFTDHPAADMKAVDTAIAEAARIAVRRLS